jgi:hypothetical protein
MAFHENEKPMCNILYIELYMYININSTSNVSEYLSDIPFGFFFYTNLEYI